MFVTSPHPLATVTVFPRPCGLLEALKHGLHSYFGATPRRAFSSAAHCFCGLTVRRCGHSLCVLNFSRFLARLCGWCGIAVLPCFSASGKVPVTRCGLPLRGTYAAYWPSSRLDCHTLMPALGPASISSAAVRSWQGGRILTRSFQRALLFPCEPRRTVSQCPGATRPLVQAAGLEPATGTRHLPCSALSD